MLDAQGRVRAASPLAATMFGARARRSAARRADPRAGAVLGGGRRRRGRRDASPLVPLAGRRANGVPFALDASVRVLAGGGLLCVLRELDRNAPGTLDAAFDAMPIGMALFNTDGEYVRVNGALCALLGRDADALHRRARPGAHAPGRPPERRRRRLAHPQRRARHLAVREALRAAGRLDRVDLRNLTFLRDEHGRPLCWVGQFQDITELRRLASRDPLTDALNRRAFDIELERAPARRRCW